MKLTDDELQTIARRRVEARTGFTTHLVMYLVANGGLVVIWALTGAGYPWFLWPLLGWGVAIVAHAVGLVLGPDTPRQLRAVDRELQRLHARGSH